MSHQTVKIYLEVAKAMDINILGKLANMNVSLIVDNTLCNHSLILKILILTSVLFIFCLPKIIFRSKEAT